MCMLNCFLQVDLWPLNEACDYESHNENISLSSSYSIFTFSFCLLLSFLSSFSHSQTRSVGQGHSLFQLCHDLGEPIISLLSNFKTVPFSAAVSWYFSVRSLQISSHPFSFHHIRRLWVLGIPAPHPSRSSTIALQPLISTIHQRLLSYILNFSTSFFKLKEHTIF